MDEIYGMRYDMIMCELNERRVILVLDEHTFIPYIPHIFQPIHTITLTHIQSHPITLLIPFIIHFHHYLVYPFILSWDGPFLTFHFSLSTFIIYNFNSVSIFITNTHFHSTLHFLLFVFYHTSFILIPYFMRYKLIYFTLHFQSIEQPF